MRVKVLTGNPRLVCLDIAPCPGWATRLKVKNLPVSAPKPCTLQGAGSLRPCTPGPCLLGVAGAVSSEVIADLPFILERILVFFLYRKFQVAGLFLCLTDWHRHSPVSDLPLPPAQSLLSFLPPFPSALSLRAVCFQAVSGYCRHVLGCCFL